MSETNKPQPKKDYSAEARLLLANDPYERAKRDNNQDNRNKYFAKQAMLSNARLDRARFGTPSGEATVRPKGNKLRAAAVAGLLTVGAGAGVMLGQGGQENPYDVSQEQVDKAKTMTPEELQEAGLTQIIVQPGETLGDTADRVIASLGAEQTRDNRDDILSEMTEQAKALDGNTVQQPGDPYYFEVPQTPAQPQAPAQP